ncbi:MAG: exo-alpha-sialidase [Planctomycetia bacterium]|nr:exo-alpha-sialidase [Planctomycetia bacterium]
MNHKLLAQAALVSSLVIFGAVADGQDALLTIEPTAEQPRNSEGDVVELRDGRLCLIYTKFTGGTADDSAADLALRVSQDGGKSWSDDQIVVRHEGGQNAMSVSLLRLADGRIALFYLNKQSPEDCRPLMRISNDEAATFGPPISCIPDEVGYYVLNNDRAVQLHSGRLVLPVALHNQPGQEKPDWAGRVMCYLSDDVGQTWRRSDSVLEGRSAEGKRVTIQEPGVVELKDDRLMMFCRTNAGSQYVAYSPDQGNTWSELTPSNLHSPVSPATIERIPWSGELLCVWNDHSGVHPFTPGKRTPHCVAISRDEGQTWSRSRVIEPDPDGWYCYTSLTILSDRVLLTYCAGDSKVGGLNRLKMVSLARNWLAEVADAGVAAPAENALLETCLDYGRSFVNTKADFNSPRFWIESRCRIVDETAGKTVEFLQCGLCKSENTFVYRDLFQQDNYDFLPVFTAEEGIIFRRKVRVTEPYRDVRPVDQWWGGIEVSLRPFRGRVLNSPDEVFAAMQAGKLIVGQTQLRDEASGRVAVIEYPIKTINFERNRKDWQVDTGPVILPDLTAPPEQWSQSIRLAHIAFRTPYWADFLVDQPTPVQAVGAERIGESKLNADDTSSMTYHFSGYVTHAARNVLLALDEE